MRKRSVSGQTGLTVIGENISAMASRAGITQVALASKLNIDPKTLRLYLRGGRPFPEHLRNKLSEIFCIGVDEIFSLRPYRAKVFEFITHYSRLESRMQDLVGAAKSMKVLQCGTGPWFRNLLWDQLRRSEIRIELAVNIEDENTLAELVALHEVFSDCVSIRICGEPPRWLDKLDDGLDLSIIIFDDTDALIFLDYSFPRSAHPTIAFHVKEDGVSDIQIDRWNPIWNAATAFDLARAKRLALSAFEIHKNPYWAANSEENTWNSFQRRALAKWS